MTECTKYPICPLEPLHKQVLDNKTRIAELSLKIVDGPDDYGFVRPLIEEINDLKATNEDLYQQIGAIIACSTCSWR